MKERLIKNFLYPIIFFHTSILPVASENQVEECDETDTQDNIHYWVVNEAGTPKRISPDPESEILGRWPAGTELIGECLRIVEIEINGTEHKVMARLMRAVGEEEDSGGWMIASIDHPYIAPPKE